MPQDLTDDKSTLVQVMAWCRLATSHYLSQCWLSSLLPFEVTRPQWVNSLAHGKCGCDFKNIIFKLIKQNSCMGICCKIAFRWMPQNLGLSEVNICSGNGLVSSGNKLLPIPQPVLTQISVTLWHDLGTMIYHTDAWLRWPMFCKQHSQMDFYMRLFLYFDSNVTEGRIRNKTWLVHHESSDANCIAKPQWAKRFNVCICSKLLCKSLFYYIPSKFQEQQKYDWHLWCLICSQIFHFVMHSFQISRTTKYDWHLWCLICSQIFHFAIHFFQISGTTIHDCQ